MAQELGNDLTRTFNVQTEQELEIRHILLEVYDALNEKGYNPVNQIVGYILSEDPTYITNHKNARSLIRKIDRDELLNILVRNYLLRG
ncbi:MAG: IreB family regulatory phosphoprotein [Clostridia bacterium]|mgnify:CR=1 FL=1|nr:IreB family regulatory phosphoprotein [Clostridia bacterium]